MIPGRSDASTADGEGSGAEPVGRDPGKRDLPIHTGMGLWGQGCPLRGMRPG